LVDIYSSFWLLIPRRRYAERIDYYVQMQRIGRTDPIHRSELLFLKPIKKDSTSPILPLDSDDPNAFRNSPLYPLCMDPDDPDEMASELMGPGPWTFHADLQLPTCARLKFTNKNKKSNIMVGHVLKFVLRVERGGDDAVDPKTGKRRLFDIIVQTPVQILSVSERRLFCCLSFFLLKPSLSVSL
jgi:hypothetical protein